MFQVEDVVKPWRDLALLWRSQLSSEGFTGLIYALSLERAWNGDRQAPPTVSGVRTFGSTQAPATFGVFATSYATMVMIFQLPLWKLSADASVAPSLASTGSGPSGLFPLQTR